MHTAKHLLLPVQITTPNCLHFLAPYTLQHFTKRLPQTNYSLPFSPFHTQLNAVQMVLATGGTPLQTYLILFYRKLQWTTGDLSGGSEGLGGTKAQVGYASGNNQNQNLPGTGTNAVLDLPYQSNIGRRGVFVLRVDQGNQCNTPAAQALPPFGKETVVY